MLVRQPGGTAVATTRLEPAGQGVRADARLGRLVLAVAATATVLIVYAVHASLPANSVQLPFENQLAIREFVPEGWAFFTKSPLTVYPVPYVHGAGGWRSATWIASGARKGPRSRCSSSPSRHGGGVLAYRCPSPA